MDRTSTCPSRNDLARLLSGQTPEPEALALEEHVADCRQCLEATRALHPHDDTLIEAVRCRAKGPASPPDEAAERLIAQLCLLGPIAPSGDTIAIGLPATPAGDDLLTSPTVPTSGSDDIQEICARLAPPESADEIGRLGGYRLLRVLGRGGMGVVFLAEDLHLQRPVALKVVRPALAAQSGAHQRFLREARIAAKVKHDRIVTIYQVGAEGGLPFLAMELLEGEALSDRLEREPTLPTTDVLRIGREIAEGLAVAHRRGLIHRDIKPSNVWLESSHHAPRDEMRTEPPEGNQRSSAPPRVSPHAEHEDYRVKLLDFGLARLAANDVELTASGIIVGTPAFMAPEQARGEAIDGRADLFSLGVILYRLCTGQLPFKGNDTISTLMALATHQPAAPHAINTAIPRPLSELVMKLLAKDPGQRCATATEVAQTLAAIERTLAEPPQPARKPALAIALAGVLVAALLGVILRITREDGAVTDVPLRPGDKIQIVEQSTAAPAPAAAPLADRSKPFLLARDGQEKPYLLIHRNGKTEDFRTFAGAIGVLHDGDTLEVHGNGPFKVGNTQVKNKSLTLRAAEGYRPQFIVDPEASRLRKSFWFDWQRGDLIVEGCDFRCPPEQGGFNAAGGALELRNCGLLHAGDRQTAGYPGMPQPLVVYSGPKLRLADCLLSALTGGRRQGVVLDLGSKVQLELVNNLIRTDISSFLSLQASGGQKLILQNNTIITDGPVLSLSASEDKLPDPVMVEAHGNLFHKNSKGPRWVFVAPRERLKDLLHWQGRENFYAGNRSLDIQHANNASVPLANLAEWGEFWGQEEEGSREAPQAFFGWDQVVQQDTSAAVEKLKETVQSLRQQTGLKDLGPDWSLMGAGEAYRRALESDSKSLPANRPEALSSGPFVILHEGQAPRGYLTLQRALSAVVDGDTIEIRTHGPFAGGVRTAGAAAATFTLRAAPGYHPVLEGTLALHSDTLILEGLQFTKGGLQLSGRGRQGVLVRMANCSFDHFESDETSSRYCPVHAGSRPRDARPLEIINCFIPGPLELYLPAAQQLSVRNSVLGPLRLVGGGTEGERAAEFTRSILWNPGLGWRLTHGEGQHPASLLHVGNGKLAVTASDCLFASGSSVTDGDHDIGSWNGSRNVYLQGHRAWNLQPSDIFSFEAWKQKWKSDADSVQLDPLDYDPHQWRRLPQSPGYRPGPAGQDFGADVSRVAVLT